VSICSTVLILFCTKVNRSRTQKTDCSSRPIVAIY